MTTIQDIESAALSLGLDDREQLLQKLMISLETDRESGYEQAWAEEIGKRVEECRSGTADLLSVEDVKANLNRIRQECAH